MWFRNIIMWHDRFSRWNNGTAERERVSPVYTNEINLYLSLICRLWQDLQNALEIVMQQENALCAITLYEVALSKAMSILCAAIKKHKNLTFSWITLEILFIYHWSRHLVKYFHLKHVHGPIWSVHQLTKFAIFSLCHIPMSIGSAKEA